MKEEIWMPIKGFSGKYEVSNFGRILSLNFKQKGTKRILNLFSDKDGYKIITLNKKQFRVHRLVAQSFIKNYNNKPQVNHINGIRDDNKSSNLEWVTCKENVLHSITVLDRTSKINLSKTRKNIIRIASVKQLTE